MFFLSVCRSIPHSELGLSLGIHSWYTSPLVVATTKTTLNGSQSIHIFQLLLDASSREVSQKKVCKELQRIKEDKLKDYEKEIKSALKI